jgi:hypothetical protein
MSVQDYRINAEVRRFLVSRWVDVARLQLGTTNGIVYIIGSLDTTIEDRKRLDGLGTCSEGERILVLVRTIEREIRRIRDVRDVVFKLDTVVKRAGRWRMRGPFDAAKEPLGTEHRPALRTAGGAVQAPGPDIEKGRET